jgi:glycosyltransferase involved in cell wall biosynthesis
MRFHLLGLAHIPTNKQIESCAYSQKIRRLSAMLRRHGHEVLFYGIENSDVDCNEFTKVVDGETLRKVYGDYDWKKDFFKHDPKDEAHQTFNRNAIEAIKACKKPRDTLLCPMGNYQKPIADAVGVDLVVESGIGYEGIFCSHRVFESYAWMHYLYGRVVQNDGSFYDTVIPNAYHPSEFPFEAKKDDYLLYIGRLIDRKGVRVAIDTAKRTGRRLLIAGQGDINHFCNEDERKKYKIEYLGTVLGEQKVKLYQKAHAVMTPTFYIGPFEGVAVEAQMTGTPAIATDWGCFAETIENGVSGYRCRTLGEFVQAVIDVEKLDPKTIHERAVRLYSTDVVSDMYHRYFKRLQDLFGDGWYTT